MIAVSAFALVAVLLGAPFALAFHGVTTRISVTSGDPGEEAQQPNGAPSISGDGRFVAFVSGDQLAPEDTNHFDDVYLRDRLEHTTTLISLRDCIEEPPPVVIGSVPPEPEAGIASAHCVSGDAFEPSISDDGMYVAFTSDADDIAIPDATERALDTFRVLGTQVYVHDRVGGETNLVSVDDADDVVAEEEHDQPTLSEDGSLVAFRSTYPFTVDDTYGGSGDDDDGDDGKDVFVRAWQTEPTYTLASPRAFCPGGGEIPPPCPARDVEDPVIAAQGAFVAFASRAVDIEAETGGFAVPDSNGTRPDIYLRDLLAETTEIVSRESDGEQQDRDAGEPSISADGNSVAFTWMLDDGEPALGQFGSTHVFVRDRGAGTTVMVSATSTSPDIATGSSQPSISADGQVVAFSSFLADLVEDDTNEAQDVFVHDLASATTQRVSVASDDTEGNLESYEPALSADGLHTAFTSSADTLVEADDNGEQDVFVHDRSRPAAAILNPDPVEFGEHLVGTTTAPLTVTVLSAGEAQLLVTDVAIAGGDATDFAVDDTDCIGAVLPPGELCSIDVVFTPGAVGPRASTLTVTNNAPDSPQSVVLTGVGTEAALDVTPALVDFGPIPVGEVSGNLFVTALSIGSGPVTITDVTLGGPDQGDFTASADCTGVTLAPGAMCAVAVTLAPSAVGVRSGQLIFTHTAADSPTVVTLTGVGLGTGLVLSPDPVDFGEVDVGETAGPLVATALNIGQLPASITSLTIGGAHADEFVIDDTSCLVPVLPPGAACMVTLLFTPQAEGTRVATLDALNTTVDNPRSVTLTGTAVPRAAIEVSPDVTDFREVVVGTTSPPAQITVRSVGTAPATISGIGLAGEHAAEFVSSDDDCTGQVLAPSEQCTVTIRFTPAEAGQRTGQLEVEHDAADSAAVAVLLGTGLEPELQLDPPLGRRGFVTTAIGTGFPPLEDVSLAWDRGLGEFAVTADAEGSFRIIILVMRRDLLGPRALEATGDGFTVTAPYLVVPGPVFPPEFTNRY